MDDQKRLKILLVNTGASLVSQTLQGLDVLKNNKGNKEKAENFFMHSLMGISGSSPIKILLDNKTSAERTTIFDNPTWSSNLKSGRNPRLPGLYILAYALRSHGHFVETVEYANWWGVDELEEWHKALNYVDFDVIGFSQTFTTSAFLNETIDFFKNKWPNAMTVVGSMNGPDGPQVKANYSVKGFGEKALLEIIDYHFYGKKGLKYLPGSSKGSKIVDALTFYPTHLAEDRDYFYDLNPADLWNLPGEIPTVELSRGCKFACKYCNYPLLGMRENTNNKEESIYRLLQEGYDRYGITNFVFGDDTVNADTQNLEALVRIVNRLSYKPSFGGYVRLDLFKTKPHQIDLCAEAGFSSMVYGIETLDRSVGKIIGKGMHKQDTLETLDNTYNTFKKYNLPYFARTGMIIGLPGQTIENYCKDIYELEDFSSEREHHLWLNLFPLYIISKYSDSISSISALGVDLERYGYKRMGVDKILSEYKKWILQDIELDPEMEAVLKEAITKLTSGKAPAGAVNGDRDVELAIWENDHTNFIECLYHYARIASEKRVDLSGPQVWQMHNIDPITFEPRVTVRQMIEHYIKYKIQHTKLFTKHEEKAIWIK